ncbi:N-acetylglucosaminidase [Carnobacteriaceae bacterium 52-44]
MNKKNLLITSGIITLSLLNINYVHAEEGNIEELNVIEEKKLQNPEETPLNNPEESPQEYKKELSEETQQQFNQIITQLNSVMKEEQKKILNGFISKESFHHTLFIEAVVFHDNSLFEQANKLYHQILHSEEPVSDDEKKLIQLLIEATDANVHLFDIDYLNNEKNENIENSSLFDEDEENKTIQEETNNDESTASATYNSTPQSIKKSANELYNEAMYASFASDAWDAALKLKKQYPADVRITQAVNKAANRLFTLGVNNHNKGHYDLAIDYYNRILSEDSVHASMLYQVNAYSKQASNKQPLQTADELYNGAMYANFASDAWESALKLKAQYISDERINHAINQAASRLFTLGVNNHNKGNYSLALDYYNRILSENSVNANIINRTESNSKRAAKNLPLQTIEELYNEAMYADFASDAWEAALDFKAQYPNDSRVNIAINKAAERMMVLGKNNHQKGNYDLALDYYIQVLSDNSVSRNVKIEASGFKSQAQKKHKLQTADDLYREVKNAAFASDAWDVAQQLKEYFPSDDRLFDVVNKAAQRLYILGTDYHQKGNFVLAISYYDRILSDNLVRSTLRKEVDVFNTQAKNNKVLQTANSLYAQSLNATIASDAWEAAQNLQTYFPSDPRITVALNSSAKRLYILGTDNHRNGNFSLAQNYYKRIMSVIEVNKSLRNEVEVYNNQAKEKIKLRTAQNMYDDAMNAQFGSDAWAYANELATYFTTELKTVEALSKAGDRILTLGTNSHIKGNYDRALHYYELLLASPYTNTSHRVKADSYSYLAKNRYSLSNLIIREVSYKHTLENIINIQMNNNPQIWDSSVKNGPWRKATRSELKAYLDPSGVQLNSDFLQFLRLSGSSGISVKDLNKELENAGILKNMGAIFQKASKEANINELYLISHALLETGNGSSSLSTGILVDEVNGKKVTPRIVYNMFGIGAIDSAPDKKGSERAYTLGWFTPEEAIIGGAKWISDSYINNSIYNQDTLYKMRWNPNRPGTHQYATDIAWAYKQTSRLMSLVELSQKYDLVLNFEVPLYD